MADKLKSTVKKTVYLIKGEEKSFDDVKEWEKWNEKFSAAYAQYKAEEFNDFELVYRGTKETVKNINSKSRQRVKKTNNVPNIVYELTESQVNTTLPESNVKSKKPGFDDQAKMIQEKIMSDFSNLNADTISDINERNTYIHGISAVLVNWNNNLGTHEYVGEKELINYHPKQIIPQPNVYDIEKMDYMFLMGSVTKQEIYEKYGIDVSGESEQYPEINELTGESGGTSFNEKVTEIVCLYRDKEGDVGKFTWTGATPLENKPKYFYPRIEKCRECGFENEQGVKECKKCGSKKLTTEIVMEETIQYEMELSPIVYPRKKKVVNYNPDGTPYVDINIEHVVIERTVPAGTKVPIPAPKFLPIAVRVNVPLNFSFRGRSDVETIRDQQESIKKTWSKAEEKILYAGGVIGIPQKLNKQVSDDVYQVWKGNPADLQSIVKHDFQSNIQQDIQFSRENYDWAKNVLGITDSWQGKYDPSAKSGVAKEIQVEQSAGRLQSKIKNKFKFYSDLFKIMFYFDLCFTHEPRPYITQNSKGDDEFKEFNKYELLVQDKAGEWYYNTDFIFKADNGNNLPQDKTFLYEQVVQFAQYQMISKEQFWEILSYLDFPIANRILEQSKAEEKEQSGNDAKIVLEALKGMPTEEAMAFLEAPIEEQLAMIDEMKQSINETTPS